MISRLVVQTALFVAVLALLLFLPAGTVRWVGAWVFLAMLGIGSLAVGFWLARYNPELLAERMVPPVRREQEPWDRVLMGTVGLSFCGWLVLMAIDAQRMGWSRVPIWAQTLGALLVAICYVGVALIFKENSFASPVVRLQKDRGQTVISTGAYRWVRHPMYAEGMLFFLGAPLLLGSWWGLVSIPLMLAVFVARALGEERLLIKELPGYAEYAARVKSRFIPGIW